VRRKELDNDSGKIRDTLAALEDGTRSVLSDPHQAISAVAKAAASSPGQVRAQLTAVKPALSPPIRLQPASLRGWATFDTRFGILSRPPDVAKTFDTTVAP
jgi:hypothetical protein